MQLRPHAPVAPPAPYVHQEYPKMLFRGKDNVTVNDPDQEQSMKDSGWSEDRPAPTAAAAPELCENCKKLIAQFDARWNEAQRDLALAKIGQDQARNQFVDQQKQLEELNDKYDGRGEVIRVMQAAQDELQAKLQDVSDKLAKATAPKAGKKATADPEAKPAE